MNSSLKGRHDLLSALAAIKNGFAFTLHDGGDGSYVVIVDNPDYRPDNGSNPFMEFRVAPAEWTKSP